MLEGGLFIGDEGRCEVRDALGVVLAVGGLSVHPGSQMVAGEDVASAVQFSGRLTEDGLLAVSS